MPEESRSNDKFLMMTQTPVERLVVQLSIPTIITMLISAMYNMADTYFVGQIGTSATAGVGVSFSLMAIIQALGFFFGHGSGNYISRQLGAKNLEAVSRMAATGFFSAWVLSAVVAAAALFNLESVAIFLGATETILPYACDYLKYILIAAPWMASSLMLNNLLRFQGSAVYGTIGMATGAILNIGLDPLLIFVFDMGVAGAAIATMISQVVSCIILLAGCTRKDNIPIRISQFTFKFSYFKEILRGGVPSLARQGLASIATIYLNQTAGAFGDAAIAAVSVVNRIVMFSNSALIGFGQGFQPVCGFNYGAGRYDRVRKAFWFCVKVAFVVLLVLAVAGLIFAPQVIALFRNDPEVISIGTLTLRLLCSLFPLASWVIMSNMMLQTMGKAGRASLLAVVRQGVFLLAFLLILVPRFGLLGIQLSQPLAELATFILAIPVTLSVLRELKDAEEGQNAIASAPAEPTPPEISATITPLDKSISYEKEPIE